MSERLIIPLKPIAVGWASSINGPFITLEAPDGTRLLLELPLDRPLEGFDLRCYIAIEIKPSEPHDAGDNSKDSSSPSHRLDNDKHGSVVPEEISTRVRGGISSSGNFD